MSYLTRRFRQEPKTFVDPRLGRLSLVGSRWIGEASFRGRKVGLLLVSRGTAPEEDIVDTTVQKLADLESVVPVALRHLASTGVSDAIVLGLELCGLSVVRAHPDWVRTIQPKPNPIAADSITPGQIVWNVQFSAPGDLNVYEVTFFGEEPIEADYH